MTGAQFKALRKAAGLSLTQSAQILGVNRATIARWQRDDLGKDGSYAIPVRAVEALIAHRPDDAPALRQTSFNSRSGSSIIKMTPTLASVA